MPVINRVLSKKELGLFIKDFANLIKIVNNSMGELDIAIREHYLNVYFKGNSLAKISFKEPSRYKVDIHKKFFEGTQADDPKYYEKKSVSNSYVSLFLSPNKPPLRILQKKHIDQFCGRVNQVNYGEEIVFEQALITDNMGRDDLIIIDRQVTDKKIGRKRLDLLALKQLEIGVNEYHFLVIEVKLGKNPELKQAVANQLDGYVEHITKYFIDYKTCYQDQYLQKKAIRTIKQPPFDSIAIVEPVKGLIVVGGYSKAAKSSIIELKKHFPDIQTKQFEFTL